VPYELVRSIGSKGDEMRRTLGGSPSTLSLDLVHGLDLGGGYVYFVAVKPEGRADEIGAIMRRRML